jgi:hypothetical protein
VVPLEWVVLEVMRVHREIFLEVQVQPLVQVVTAELVVRFIWVDLWATTPVLLKMSL